MKDTSLRLCPKCHEYKVIADGYCYGHCRECTLPALAQAENPPETCKTGEALTSFLNESEQENESIIKSDEGLCGVTQRARNLISQCRQLQAENQELRKDRERKEWLKHNLTVQQMIDLTHHNLGNSFDDAIDTAIAAQTKDKQ